MVAHPVRDLSAVALRHGDALAIHGADGELTREAESLFGFKPAYRVRRDSQGAHMIPSAKQGFRYGFIDLAATDSHIFALFSGRSPRTTKAYAAAGEYVIVYDWQGHLVSTYALDADAWAIGVDQQERQLVTTRQLPTAGVTLYRLPPILAGEKP